MPYISLTLGFIKPAPLDRGPVGYATNLPTNRSAASWISGTIWFRNFRCSSLSVQFIYHPQIRVDLLGKRFHLRSCINRAILDLVAL